MRLKIWLHLALQFFAVLILCVSCGKKGQEKSPWPAVVVKISDVSEASKTSIRSAISHLNEQLGVTAISEGEANNHYWITIHEVAPPSPGTQNGNQDGTQSGAENRAGLAIFDNESCEIQISPGIIDNRPALLEPVLWHELGHCAGLPHNPTQGELMYHSTSVDGHYTPEAIRRFLKAFASAAGIGVK